MIYFIEDKVTGHIKIGHAGDPWKRLTALQVSSPTDLALLAVADGGPEEEAVMHQRFASHRIRGEWFARSSPVEEVLAALGPAERPVRTDLAPAMSASAFRKALVEIGISQAQLARILGRAPNTITGWVNADAMPLEARLFCRVAKDHGLDYAKEAGLALYVSPPTLVDDKMVFNHLAWPLDVPNPLLAGWKVWTTKDINP